MIERTDSLFINLGKIFCFALELLYFCNHQKYRNLAKQGQFLHRYYA